MSLSKLSIATLCFVVALLVPLLAAPSKRVPSLLVVTAPFAVLGIAALVAARRGILHERAFAARRSDQSTASLIPDVHAFIREAPALASKFQSWARDRVPGDFSSRRDLEGVATSLGNSIDFQSDMFLPWVAAVGEVRRHQVGGRWSVARWIGRGEPVVVSGRFPYVRIRPLQEAVELLDVGSSIERV